MQIPDLSIDSLKKLYRNGSLTPRRLVEQLYDEIERRGLAPVWISLVPRSVLLQQAESLVGRENDPLYGIPFAVKDNIDVADLVTTAGCPAFGYTATETAFVVDRLQQSGALLIGKTNLDQFATGLVGTRSPYGACSSAFSHEHISGGSSSGSAVAVASGLVSFALGTDTAGSGRVPAAFNNLVGLKPTRGLLSAANVVPACRSLDCVSIFALNCSDAAQIFRVAKAFDPGDAFSRQSSNLVAARPLQTIGIPKQNQLEFFGNEEYSRLFQETVDVLKRDGIPVVEFDMAPFLEAASLLYAGPYVAERFAAVGHFVKEHRDSVDPVVGNIIADSERWSAADAYQALYRLHKLKATTDICWKASDALLVPTAPTTYTIAEIAADPVRLNSNLGHYTNFVNLLDLCGVATPAGFTEAGLPFGVTAIGPAFQDDRLLLLADRIQRARVAFHGNHLSSLNPTPLLQQNSSIQEVQLSVVGAHLSGQPLNHQLTDRGARLLRTNKTAPDYKFYALINTTPAKPGLVRTPGFCGPGIETEVWTMPSDAFGSFVAAVPPPLAIGSCVLEDGSVVKGFICEPYGVEGMPDITHLASWRAYLASKK
jgi:allophanate hydrolase